MNKERMLKKIGYGVIIAVAAIVLLVASCATQAQPQAPEVQQVPPQASVEALPVTCVTPKQAEAVVNGAFDTMLLQGKSVVSGYAMAVLFNRTTGDYAVVILTDDNRVCFVDIGVGGSSVLQKFI